MLTTVCIPYLWKPAHGVPKANVFPSLWRCTFRGQGELGTEWTEKKSRSSEGLCGCLELRGPTLPRVSCFFLTLRLLDAGMGHGLQVERDMQDVSG